MATSKPKKLTYKTSQGNPKAIPKELYPPEYFSEKTNEFYLYILRTLLAGEIIQPSDYQTVLLLGHVYNYYSKSAQDVQNNGVTYKTISSKGEPVIKQNPAVKLMNDFSIQLQKLLIEFGLTPKSRGQFKQPDSGGQPDIPLLNFLNR